MKLLFLFDAPYNYLLPIASRAFVYLLLLYGLYFSCHYAHNWMAIFASNYQAPSMWTTTLLSEVLGTAKALVGDLPIIGRSTPNARESP
jgi:hypothetical protein